MVKCNLALSFLFFSTFWFSSVLLAQTPDVKFGVTLTLAGDSAPFAVACNRGIELASEEINVGGGIQGLPLKVIVESIGNLDLKMAASAAHKLISIDKVKAIFPNWSEDTEVIAPIAEKANLVSMTLGAGGPRATRFAPSSFRATTADTELIAEAVRRERAAGNTRACIFTADSSYYVDILEDIKHFWLGAGGQILFEGVVPYNATDLNSGLARLRAKLGKDTCDTFFVWTSPTPLTPLARGLLSQGVKGNRVLPWFTDDKAIVALLKKDSPSHRVYRYAPPGDEFIQKFRTKFGDDSRRPAANCYDGIKVMAKVMNEVGFERDAVRSALLQLSDYSGATGAFVVRADRERVGEKITSSELLGAPY